ncbi:hypothetical protein MSAS_12330 [Mycobacterium saskatchewanense]|uniref:SHOCT domain-containing protein n=1 Tax=Mycobacterium saskatchewanense TaxID=220927 RepID=A0AAJ3TXJ9_9MYCO|nr:SHOCT domain-containing protein [Mycobacterium saskatchewanense]ORW73497.1 hypothetical protein AWC23_06915 [Mycobacterium saskatchewanense]BBX62059.1 hypothetical protein MSAS_12330 [Mycobacterium saskatchewanense]
MSSRRLAKISLAVAIAVMVAALAGFIITLVLNAFFLDKYNQYGEVSVPGSGSLNLPAGDVTVSFHTIVIGSPSGGGLPVPPLGVTIVPPDGVAQPVMTENIGGTTTVNNDSHVRVWVAHIAAAGVYHVTTDGQVNGYIDPRLAFGHKGSTGHLVWLSVGLFVVGLGAAVLSGIWLARARRRAVLSTTPAFQVSPGAPYEPSGEGVRLHRLKTLAALRDSGALTEAEFEAEKRRILDEG